MNNQKGAIPLLLLLAGIGLLVFIFITSTSSFKDTLFNTLFPKPPSHASEVSPSVPDEILLKFKPGVSEEAKQQIKNEHAMEILETIPKIEVLRVKVNAQSKETVLKALSNNPNVEYAEPNYIGKTELVPNDPAYANAQWNLKKIGMPPAWDIITGNSSVIVAVIDSGVYAIHEDLTGKVLPGYNILTNQQTPTDNTVVNTAHGTVVAGIISSITNNGKGIASVGWDMPVMPLIVVNSSGTFYYSDLSSAIIWASDHGAKIINMSLGGDSSSSTLQSAVNYAWNKGVVLVAAAGNNGTCCIKYPAAADNVIAVGSTTGSDTKANHSNIGDKLDVMAPGEVIWSLTIPTGYANFAGTSFATPHVSALSALIMSANPNLTNQQVVDIITTTALDLGASGWDDNFGWGRIQADKALQMATGATPAPTSTPTATPSPTVAPPPAGGSSDTTPPTVSITNPLNGVIVKPNSKVTIQATASDNIAISKVEFYQGTTLKCTDATSPYSCIFSVPGKKNTNYIITVKAYDASNNTSSASITVKAQ